jgi:hypothetical protein
MFAVILALTLAVVATARVRSPLRYEVDEIKSNAQVLEVWNVGDRVVAYECGAEDGTLIAIDTLRPGEEDEYEVGGASPFHCRRQTA